MARRRLLAGGVAAWVSGLVLLGLGLGWDRGRTLPFGGVSGAERSSSAPAGSAADVAVDGSLAATPAPRQPTEEPAPAAAPAPPLGEDSRTSDGASPARWGGDLVALPPRPAPSDEARPHPPNPGLSVPAIGLSLPLRAGGVGASGVVVPPAGHAVWIRGYGRVVPGDVGTAVVAGHVSSSGRDDVFAELSSVRVGHSVVVRDGRRSRTFVVRRAEVVTKSALPRDADVWGANTSRRRVVLVTCDDDLGFRSDGHRVANYVVVAEAA